MVSLLTEGVVKDALCAKHHQSKPNGRLLDAHERPEIRRAFPIQSHIRQERWTYIKCIRSFSASSSSVWIHPASRFMSRRLRKCRRVAATIPGTPAMDSKKRIR